MAEKLDLFDNVSLDEKLGRYIVIAGQIQGDPRFPEEAWHYLDFAKIGAEYYADVAVLTPMAAMSCAGNQKDAAEG